jgi:RNA polymerase sigma-B factor
VNETRDGIIARYLAQPTRANRDSVIAEHMYLCKRGARKFRRAETDPADLEQIAAIGLVKATDAYRPERTTPFEAYAWIMIVGELMHYVRDSERAVRVPRWLRSIDRRYVATWETVAAREHAEPTARQLADELDVSIAIIDQIQALRRTHRSEGDGNGPDPFATLAAARSDLSLEERVSIAMAIDELDTRERAIVLGTYGAGLSQAEIAALLRISQSQISKLLTRALGKLSKKVA